MNSTDKNPTHAHHEGDQATLVDYWEQRYSESEQMWSGKVNPVLAETFEGHAPGDALDLGCGEGGDAIWLAERGWNTVAVDISPTAIDRAGQAAKAANIPSSRLRFVAGDLTNWTPDRQFDLVTCSFLHSWPIEIPRDEILHRAASFVAPGGKILVTAHAAPPSWADDEHVHGHRFPTPESDLEAMTLDSDRWSVLVCEIREREVDRPPHGRVRLLDSVVMAERNE